MARRASTEESWPFEMPLMASAVRCSLRYVVLPFVLPLAGLASGAALGILLVLDAVAAFTIVSSLRRLWRRQHPSRWQYAFVAAALAALGGLFSLSDTGLL
jgi:hypothetical protein